MVTSQTTDPKQFPFPLDVDGRLFPSQRAADANATDTSDVPQQAGESINVSIEIEQLRSQIAASVRSAVGSLETLRLAGTTKQAILDYQLAFEQLRQVQQGWQSMMNEVAIFDLEPDREIGSIVAQNQAHDELGKWKAEVFAHPTLNPQLFSPVLTAELATRPLPDFVDSLTADIEKHIQQFTQRTVEQLFTLVDLQVVGLVVWYGSQACTYHRFYRILQTELKEQSKTDSGLTLKQGRWVRILTTFEKGTHTRRLCRHVQHVLEAVALFPWQATIVIPKREIELIAHIPRWLLPEIRLIEGELIREMVVTQDLAIREWTYKRDRIQYHRDPALVLGPFVLAAWGPTEIQAELQARNDDTMRQENLARLRAGVMALTLAVILCVCSARYPVLSLPGLIACIGAAYLLGTAGTKELKTKTRSQNVVEKPAELKLQVYAMAMVGTIAAAAFGISTGSTMNLFGFGFLAAVFVSLYVRHLLKFGLPARRPTHLSSPPA